MAEARTSERPIARYNQHQDGDTGPNQRLLYALGGGTLVLFGLSRRSLPGVGLAALGGSVAYHALTGHWPMQQPNGVDADYSVRVDHAVTINKPVEELYRFWRDFENLPKIMSHLESVTVQDDKRSHWVASAPLGKKVEWDAEIINEEPNRLIAWRSVGDADVESAGSVRFEKAPADRGTEVHVKLEYMPPGGIAGAMVAKVFQEEPNQQVRDDLRRLKQMFEAGEVATTEGQPRGS
jgi:uncharacterized membrane protein